MKKIFSIFALAVLMLLPGTGKMFAQDVMSDVDLPSVGSTGWTWVRSSNWIGKSTETAWGFNIKVTKMPNGSTPGEITLVSLFTHGASGPERCYVSSYIQDKSGRKFVVTKIADEAFTAKHYIKKVGFNYFSGSNVPRTELEIGNNAFTKLGDNLEEVEVCDISSVDCSKIGANAFKGCTNLKTMNFAVTKGGSIGAGAFSGCSSLTGTLQLSGYIDKTAFEGCTSVTGIEWYGGNSTTYNYSSDSPMYPMRNNVKSVKIYGAVPAHFFEDFKALTKVTSDAAFWDNLANTNQYQMGLGDRAFAYCSNLEEAQVAGKIHPDAFYSCSKLAKITYRGAYLAQSQIPTDYDESFFYGVRDKVTSFTIESTSTKNVPNSFIPSYLCYGMTKLTSISIPNYVQGIGEGAFRGCSALKTVSINKSNSELTVIGSTAFMDCSAMTSITLPVSLEYIYDEAFSWCENLTNCPLNSELVNLKYLGYAVFHNTGLKNLYVPANVKTIKGSIILGGSKVKCEKITFMPKNLYRENIGGSWARLFFGTEDMYTKERKAVTTFVINSEMKSIPDSLCYNFKGLVQMTDQTGTAWLNNVEYIGKAAFRNCENMWGEGQWTQLKNAYSIDEAAFEGSGFKGSIDFAELYSIGKRAFANTQLMYLHDMGSMPKLSVVEEEAFADNKKLEKAVIPAKVKNLPVGVFRNCTKLKKLDLANVETIGDNAFRLADLDTLRLPSVSSIGNSSFASNSSLKTVIITDKIPTVIADGSTNNSFNGTTVEKILGGCAVIDQLKVNTDWKNVCATIETFDMAYKYPKIYDGWWIEGEGVLDTTAELDCSGKFTLLATANEAEGWYFVAWSDGNTENPRTWDMNTPDYNEWWYSIQPKFDNESLYTEELTVNVTPEGIAQITVYDTSTGQENTRGKYKRGGNYVFVPEKLPENSWFAFSNWEYDTNKMVYEHSDDDYETYPNGLELFLNYMPMGGGMGPEEEFYEEPEFPQEITAVYKPRDIEVGLIICSDGHGTFDCTGQQRLGAELTLTAKPKEGYKFSHWNDDKSATQAEGYKLTITPEMLYKRGALPEEEGTPVYQKDTETLEPYEEWAQYDVMICAWFEDVTTGIDQTTNDQRLTTQKVLIDGRLYIQRGEHLFDATGKMVK